MQSSLKSKVVPRIGIYLLFLPYVAQTIALAEGPVVIAHRGASGYLPEHTLVAKALAHGFSADYIEQDVVLSKDGVPIVLHDIYLESVTDVASCFPNRQREDGHFYAIDFDLAELKQLRVQERTRSTDGPTVFPNRFPAGATALQISTLEEELQLIAGLNHSSGKKIGIYPEVKKAGWHLDQGQDLSAAVIALLHQYGYKSKEDRCWLQCFEWSEVKRIRHQLNWKGRLVQLMANGVHPASESDFEKMRTEAGLMELATTVDGIGPDISAIVKGNGPGDRQFSDLVMLAHRHGLQVHPYTIRADALPSAVANLDDLHQCLFVEAQVDGAFSDFPDLTKNFIDQQQIFVTRLKALPPIPVWPSQPPGISVEAGRERDTSNQDSRKVEGRWVVRLGDVASPTLTIYPARADLASGTCVLVCPGGGYNILAWNLEGTEACQWLNSIGITAALLKYRVPRANKDEIPLEPLQDAQRAMSILRSRANDWSIHENRIGMLGFSAGGNLSVRVATQTDQRAYQAIDDIDQASSRPDFAMLVYPAYLFDKKKKDQLLSPDLPITSETPPMFMIMAMDDAVGPENVLRLSTALTQAKVANELHLFPNGGHGFGLRPNQHPATHWPALATQWLRGRGLLKAGD